jgi:hypothetical protein
MPSFQDYVDRPEGRGLLRPLLLGLILLSSGTACGARQPGTRTDRSVITVEQIEEGGFRNAYDAVEALRRTWLIERPDGLTAQREIQVYLDNSRMGGVQTLRQIATAQIASIRYIDAATAINRWGVDHGLGVIMVISKK